MNQRLKDFLLFSFIITLFFTFVYGNLLGLGSLIYGDLAPFYPKTMEWLDTFLSSWSNDNLGYPGSSIESSVFNALLAFALGDNSVLAQKVFFLSVAPISCLAMFVFLNHYVTSRFARFFGGFVYGVNPVTIALFWGGSPGGGLLVQYALFPLQLYFLLGLLNEQGNRKVNVLALSLLLALASAYNVQAPIWFLPFLIAFFLAHTIIRRSLKYLAKTTLSLFFVGVLFVLLTFTTEVIYVAGLISFFFGAEKGVVWFYTAQPIPRETLIERIAVDYQYHTFDHLNFFIFLTGLSAFLTLLIRRKSKYLLSSLLVASMIVGFWQLGLMGKIWWLYDAIPFLYALNTIKMKMMLAQTFGMIVAFLLDGATTGGVHGFNLGDKLRLWGAHSLARTVKVARVAAYFVIIVIVMIPSFTINIWPELSSYTYMTGQADLSRYEVPRVYYDVRRWMNEHTQGTGFFRIFWLPMDPAIQSVLMRIFYAPNVFYPRYEEKNYTNFLYEYLTYGPIVGWTGGIGKLLAPASVKYIVINLAANKGGSIWKFDGPPKLSPWGPGWSLTWYMTGSPQEYAKLMDREENLRVVERNDDFIIYENLDFHPFIKVYDRVFYIAPKSVLNISYEFPIYNFSKSVYNLIKNPIFENGTSFWSLAGDWSIDKDAFSSGVNALKGVWNQSGWIIALQSISVRGGAAYCFSGWVKIENAKESHVRLNFYDEDNKPVKNTFPLVGTDGTRDWWRFSEAGIVPERAVRLDVQLLGGWSYDGVRPGTTWFTNVTFFEGYTPLPSPVTVWNYETILASGMNRLVDQVPGFNGTNLIASTVMLSFRPEADPRASQFLSAVDTIVLLGDLQDSSETEWISKHPTLLFIHEAESTIVPARGLWEHLVGAEFTNGNASLVRGEGSGYANFYAPRESYYSIAFRAMSAEGLSIAVDNQGVATRKLAEDRDGFTWLETDVVQLQKGWHQLSISVQGNRSILDQIVYLSNIRSPLRFEQLASSSRPSIVEREESTTLYRVKINSTKPVYVLVEQSYNLGWEGYVNGRKTEHYGVPLNMYWANLYYVNSTGLSELEASYNQQGVRILSVSIWAGAWLSSLLGLIYFSRRKIRSLISGTNRFVRSKTSHLRRNV